MGCSFVMNALCMLQVLKSDSDSLRPWFMIHAKLQSFIPSSTHTMVTVASTTIHSLLYLYSGPAACCASAHVQSCASQYSVVIFSLWTIY